MLVGGGGGGQRERERATYDLSYSLGRGCNLDFGGNHNVSYGGGGDMRLIVGR